MSDGSDDFFEYTRGKKIPPEGIPGFDFSDPESIVEFTKSVFIFNKVIHNYILMSSNLIKTVCLDFWLLISMKLVVAHVDVDLCSILGLLPEIGECPV